MQNDWKTRLILLLAALSAVFYGINYALFKDTEYMGKLVTMQLAFLPIQVILITLFLNGMIARREKHVRSFKLNMVIGSFFSEVGEHLLKSLADFDPDRDTLKDHLMLNGQWTEDDFSKAHQYVKERRYLVQMDKNKLAQLRAFLLSKRGFMLWLVENPNILEHESFTDLLMPLFHLTEELAHRDNLSSLPETDYAHLAEDIKRSYLPLLAEWLSYMNYIKASYPYFYSLAVRTNPLNPVARTEVI